MSALIAPEAVRVAVFIDWQNVYMTARRAFGLERLPVERGNFSPYRLGCLLAAANGRGRRGCIVKVEVHRGLPSQRHDRIGYIAAQRQAAAWRTENPKVVTPKLRPLHYRNYPALPPTEKGVDVALAVSAIEATLRKRCDVAVLFSHDTDLLPVPEAIARIAGPEHIETASWASDSFQGRLRPGASAVHHSISQKAFEVIETPVNYARS
ncbi:MAG TPA: NYN domain-containing protein [Solirubrobacterales bacterium]|nr:NYN domain-containing protein [Solirubrobacterales bacterium]